MVKVNNVFLSKEEIEEILHALNFTLGESQELDDAVNVNLQHKLQSLLEE